jgi:hypothetical protein
LVEQTLGLLSGEAAPSGKVISLGRDLTIGYLLMPSLVFLAHNNMNHITERATNLTIAR